MNSRPRSRRSTRRVGVILAVAVPLLVLLGACGAASMDRKGASSPGGPTRGSAGSETAPTTAAQDGTDSARSLTSGGKGQVGAPAAVVAPMSRAVVSTGQLTMHSASPSKVRAEILRLTASWNGIVADEKTDADRKGHLVSSAITLRVPAPRFSEAMTAIGSLAEVEQASRSSEDVTTQVIDNAARVRAAERSIRQIERLLDHARQLSDIIAIESDLARRQADLDSLEQQQAYLADQTSLSTINVYLSGPVAPRHAAHDPHGFLAGLGAGWQALRASTTALLTAVGAVLPFAVLVLLLGVPLWLLVRRRRPAPPATAEA